MCLLLHGLPKNLDEILFSFRIFFLSLLSISKLLLKDITMQFLIFPLFILYIYHSCSCLAAFIVCGIFPYYNDVMSAFCILQAWFRELPTGVLDSLTPEQVMHCNTEEECTQLVELLPKTEAGLLDWTINLMADVVEQEQFNKMNARNIAMVFAPNMSQVNL